MAVRDRSTDAAAPAAPGALPATLGRFRLRGLLGQGGMGRVYEAYDPQLKRHVAVKLVHTADPVSVRRFVRAARAQAGLAHPAICPVYEAGEIDGAPYIVMPCIAGRPLDEAGRELPLEEKLVLLRQVAEAVHEAHRAGLVHRDLKPGNILVEEAADGILRPFVLDFGLARPITGPGLTADGARLGTPEYMAPEQVRGEAAAIGRRTDVYALGATLYQLLAGRPPFGAGPSVYLDVVREDPGPLRPQGIPAEVEAVVFKCLEKDPGRRYGSARALAEDLGRYLEGEPVAARSAGRWYRLRKRLRRHAALVAVSAVSLVALGAALAWGGLASLRARERERLARTFTEQVEEIEALARYSQMSPLHDVRPDRELLRRRMEIIRREMEAAGPIAAGPGAYALGRGHLALGELDAAHRHLAGAWNAGYRESEVAVALGRNLSALYRQRLAGVELVRDWETRRRRLRELDRVYGAPARAYLQRSAAAGAPREPYLTALLAFHAGRLDEALATLDVPGRRRPWAYELHRLEGDIHRARALERSAADDAAGARSALALALAAYQRAAAIAPSAPAIQRASAGAAFLQMGLAAASREEVRAAFDGGLASAEEALRADPDDARAWLWKARLHRGMARSLQEGARDPTAQLAAAVEAARAAVARLAEPSEALRELARAHWGWAQWLQERGEDPGERLRLATAALDRVSPPWRDYVYLTFQGMVQMTHADHRAAGGGDAAGSYGRAIAAYRAAAARHSAPFAPLQNLGVCLFKLAALPGAGDRRELLGEAVAVFERAHRLNSDHVAPLYYLGRSRLRLAQGGAPDGGRLDPAGAERALESYRQALELAPGMYQLYSALGEAYHLQGLAAWDRGDDPEPFFQRARQAYGEGLAAAPESGLLEQNLAWTAYFQGKLRIREGRSPGPFLEEAVRLSRRSLGRADRAGALLCLGSARRLEAEAVLAAGGDPSIALAAAERAFRSLIARNPRLAEAHRSLGRLYTLRARWLGRAGGDPQEAWSRARAALGRALDLEPEAATFQLAEGRRALERARWLLSRTGTVEEELARGLAAAERALALRPGWPEAAALEATLLRLRAASRDPPDREALEDGRERLRRALEANPHLTHEWSESSQPELPGARPFSRRGGAVRGGSPGRGDPTSDNGTVLALAHPSPPYPRAAPISRASSPAIDSMAGCSGPSIMILASGSVPL